MKILLKTNKICKYSRQLCCLTKVKRTVSKWKRDKVFVGGGTEKERDHLLVSAVNAKLLQTYKKNFCRYPHCVDIDKYMFVLHQIRKLFLLSLAEVRKWWTSTKHSQMWPLKSLEKTSFKLKWQVKLEKQKVF